jgi:hypothetical protein
MVVVKCPVREPWLAARGWTTTWCTATVSTQRGTDEYQLTPLIPAGGRQRGPRSRRRGGGTRREPLPQSLRGRGRGGRRHRLDDRPHVARVRALPGSRG